jgi:hypothetical protein
MATKFIVQTDRVKNTRCLDKTYRVAVIEMDTSIASKPSRISEKAKGVVRIVTCVTATAKSSSPQCPYRLELARAEVLAECLNQLSKISPMVLEENLNKFRRYLSAASLEELLRNDVFGVLGPAIPWKAKSNV